MSEEKLKLNKELSVFNDFVVVNVFEKGPKQLMTIKHTYKPRDSEFWKNSDFIQIKKLDTLIESLQQLKEKLKGGSQN